MVLPDLVENLEMTVKPENLENLVTVDLLDLRVHEDSPEPRVCLASRVTEVTQVLTEPRERLEQWVQRESRVLPERTALLDPWALEVFPVREDVLDPVELLELVEMTVCPALLALLDPSVHLELLDSLALLAQREKLVQLVPVDLKVLRDPAESLALLDHLDHPGLLETLVLMVFLAPKDQLALPALLVLLVSLGPVDLPGLRAQPDLLDRREHPETQEFQGLKEKLDLKEKSDQQVFRDNLVLRVRKAREAPGVSPVQLDLSDHQEREELPVTAVSPVKMV